MLLTCSLCCIVYIERHTFWCLYIRPTISSAQTSRCTFWTTFCPKHNMTSVTNTTNCTNLSFNCSAICLSNMTFNESMLPSSAILGPATTHVIAQREWRLGKLTRLQQIVESLGLRDYNIAEQFVVQLIDDVFSSLCYCFKR